MTVDELNITVEEYEAVGRRLAIIRVVHTETGRVILEGGPILMGMAWDDESDAGGDVV